MRRDGGGLCRRARLAPSAVLLLSLCLAAFGLYRTTGAARSFHAMGVAFVLLSDLCAGARLDAQLAGRLLAGEFPTARAGGQSSDAAILALHTAIRRSDEYRAVRPELALPPSRPGGSNDR